MLPLVLSLVAVAVALLLLYDRKRHSFWASRGVPTPPVMPFLGNLQSLFNRKRLMFESIDDNLKKYGSSKFHGGYEFYRPVFTIGDVDLIKRITSKDFDHFVDRRTFDFSGGKDDLFNDMLTNTTGERWKSLRAVMSPTFTTGRMRAMYPLVTAKGDALLSWLHRQVKKDAEVNIKATAGLYTMDVIASCAFGIECNSLEDENAIFPQKARQLFSPPKFQTLKVLMFLLMPKLCKMLGLRFTSPVTDFFKEAVAQVLRTRQETEEKRNDFVDLMQEARQEQQAGKWSSKCEITNNVIVAESVLFLLAGFETSATAIAFASFLLAKNAKEQQILRKEMQQIVEENGKLTYESLMEAKYLDAVISESLRLYSPAFITQRTCTKDYVVPGTGIDIPKDTLISIAIWSVHHDSRYFPEPDIFRPERFLPENKGELISGSFLAFGQGPRNCIGIRFALMETKVALAKMILEFQLSLSDNYREVIFDRTSGIFRPLDNKLPIIFKPLVAT